jgi:transposase
VCDIAGYTVPVLQNGALKWKKELTGVRHDNARPHASGAVSEILEKYGWQVLPHPLYSPDMSPPDFDLFPKLKKTLRGKRFRSIEEVSNEVTPSNQTHQQRRRPDRNTRLAQTLDRCDKAQWRLN